MGIVSCIRYSVGNLMRRGTVSIRIPVERWETILEALDTYERAIDDCYEQAQNIDELNSLMERQAAAGTARVTIRGNLDRKYKARRGYYR